MAFRYMEDFNRDEMMKYAKGELVLEGKPFTQENIEKKMDDLYYEWLASRVNDVIHKDDGINDTLGILYTLRKVPIKYCVIVEQWMEGKPIHYEGEHFTFEEIYDKESFVNELKNENNSISFEFKILITSICYFKNYEQQEKSKPVTRMDISKIKNHLEYEISNHFFHHMRDYWYLKNVLKLDI